MAWRDEPRADLRPGVLVRVALARNLRTRPAPLTFDVRDASHATIMGETKCDDLLIILCVDVEEYFALVVSDAVIGWVPLSSLVPA